MAASESWLHMLNFLTGGGRMAEVIRTLDWSDHPLGPPVDWPPVLKITVSLMLCSPFPQSLFWGREEKYFLNNDAYKLLMGNKPDGTGKPLREVWPEIWDEINQIADQCFDGTATFNADYPLHILRGPEPEDAWFTFSYSPVRNEMGEIVGTLNTVIETTETVLTKRRIELLNSELAHRMKNTFSVVGAISSQTFRAGSDPVEAQSSFAQRLGALAKAQDLVVSGEWGRAALADIITATIGPLLPSKDALELEGCHLELAGRQTHTLALGLHELATNAAKYGALSRPSGRVRVSWSAGEPGTAQPFELVWQEIGGPAVSAPARTGFGSRLVTRALPAEFQGTGTIEYPTEGLRFALRTEMRSLHKV